MTKQYEYVRDGIVRGPVTGQEVRRLVAAGEIGPADLLRTVGDAADSRWVPARKVKNLRFDEAPLETDQVTAPTPVLELDDVARQQAAPPAPPLPALDGRKMSQPASESPASLPEQNRTLIDFVFSVLWGCLAFVLAWPVGFAVVLMAFKAFNK